MGEAKAAAARPRTTSFRGLLGRIDQLAWLESLRVTTVARVAFLAVAFAATWYLNDAGQGRSTVGFLDMWHRWDAVHFVDISTFGYFGAQTHPEAAAFFPLLPLL